jgi:hypothetical protein
MNFANYQDFRENCQADTESETPRFFSGAKDESEVDDT